jgi:hypothetical protein
MVIASHWHDDHVAGLSQIVASAEQAQFVCSMALKTDEFVELVAAADLRPMVYTTSGVHEFHRVLDSLKETGRTQSFAICDRLLINRAGPPEVKMQALSPSDASIFETFADIAELFKMQANPNRLVVPRPKRNPGAVVLHLRVGNIVLLLCSDLEVHGEAAKGWTAVLNATARPTERASWVKVSHHGSSNGHDDRVWADMLDAEPHAALTPYLSGKTPLPRDTDIARLVALTPNVYITRRPGSASAKRDSRVQKMVDQATKWITTEPTSVGSVRFRRPINVSSGWTVHLSGNAMKLTG